MWEKDTRYLTVIEDVQARKVMDSRGNFTVEVEIYTKEVERFLM